MQRKGVCYDVGLVMSGNWRPIFDPKIIKGELEIIKNDLHCNAVRIRGLDTDRLTTAATFALDLGLEVWFCPEMWDKSQAQTLEYIGKAAKSAEELRAKWPEQIIFLVGGESTLFMQGIVPGKNVTSRMMKNWQMIKEGKHNKPLNEFLAKANSTARQFFHGQVTYASLVWEKVDWELFDFACVDHYWQTRIKDQYLELLKPVFDSGKPVIISEFGFRTYKGAESATEGMAGDLTDSKQSLVVAISYLANSIRTALFGTQLAPPRFKLKKGNWVRDEKAQADELIKQLKLLDQAKVNGAFISTFVSPIAPFSENPDDNLDINSYSLVKSLDKKLGTTYPNMPWEPKESFRAVADYYSKHQPKLCHSGEEIPTRWK